MSKIELDLSRVTLGFAEKPVDEKGQPKAGTPLATLLGSTVLGLYKGQDAAKLAKVILWIGDLEESTKLVVDSVDAELLKEVIIASEAVTTLGKKRLLDLINKAIDDSKKEPEA